jgi:hypothetical protein
MFAWRKTLSLCLISVIVEFELHTRKITLDLLKKNFGGACCISKKN